LQCTECQAFLQSQKTRNILYEKKLQCRTKTFEDIRCLPTPYLDQNIFHFFQLAAFAFYKLKRMMRLQPSVLLAESIFAASLL
jgi:hypothetical protein